VSRIAPEKNPVNLENPPEMNSTAAASRIRADTIVVISNRASGVASGRNLKKVAERTAVKHSKSVCGSCLTKNAGMADKAIFEWITGHTDNVP
jgi:hypothetical protein